MKNKILILALVLLAEILFSGCFVQPPPEYEPVITICETKDDCVATCEYGCVYKEWMDGRIDCKNLPGFDCDCINNKCVKAEIQPTDEKTEKEIDDLFEDELDSLPEEDLTELEKELA